MNEEKVIEKAKKALDKLNITYDKDNITVSHYDKVLLEAPVLLEMFKDDENYKNEYSIGFQLESPGKLTSHIFVIVEKSTNKLLYVGTKFNRYEIPKGFE